MHWMLLALALVLAPVLACAEDLTACDKALDAEYANNLDGAIAHYTRCLEDGSLSTINRAIVFYNLGVTHAAKKQDAEAMANFDASIRVVPDGIVRTSAPFRPARDAAAASQCIYRVSMRNSVVGNAASVLPVWCQSASTKRALLIRALELRRIIGKTRELVP